jgi:hypothetical protein
VIFLLTGHTIYLCFSAALIVWFALQYPNRTGILSELGEDELSVSEAKNDRY